MYGTNYFKNNNFLLYPEGNQYDYNREMNSSYIVNKEARLTNVTTGRTPKNSSTAGTF